MSETPTPTKANADTHRQDEEETDTGQDLASVPDDMKRTGRDSGGDGGGGGGGMGDDPDGGNGGAGSLVKNALSNKRLVGMAALAVGAGLLYLYYKNSSGPSENPTDLEDIDTDDGAPTEDTAPKRPNIDKPPNDPLVADDQAFDWVFGDDPRSDSEHPQGETVGD